MTVPEALIVAAGAVGSAWWVLDKFSGHPGPEWWFCVGAFIVIYALARETMVRR